MGIHGALRRLPISGKDFCQSCFSGAVSTNQPYFVTFVHAEVNPVHQNPGADANFKVAHANHLKILQRVVAISSRRQKSTSWAGFRARKPERNWKGEAWRDSRVDR